VRPRSYDPNDRFLAEFIRPATGALGQPRQPDRSASATRTSGGAPAWGLVGIPFDGAVISRRGTSQAPPALRTEFLRLKPWRVAGGKWEPAIYDYGDVETPSVPPDASPAVRDDLVRKAHEAIEQAARCVRADGRIPVGLGGDHSITYALVRAQGDSMAAPEAVLAGRAKASRHGGSAPIGVVNVDAHLDLRDPRHGLTSGTPFRRILAETELLRPVNLVVAGARDFATSPFYGAEAESLGVGLIGVDTVAERPDEAARQAIGRAARGTRGVYVSLDFDAVDNAAGPGASAPGIGGLSAREWVRFLGCLGREAGRRTALLGCDLVELAPPLDPSGASARLAAAGLGAFLSSYNGASDGRSKRSRAAPRRPSARGGRKA
jgi:formimidoylglutamase